jgi:Flp pilus assembly protein TadD
MPEFAPGQQAAAFYASALQQRRLYRHAYEQYQALSSGVEPSPWLIHNMLASLASAPTVEDRLAIARAVAEQHSGMEEAWLGLAMVARAVKDTAAEDDALARAVEVVPASAVAWQRRAEFLEREKRVPEAQQAYESLVALAPQSAAANNNLAYCILMTGGDQKLALEHAQRARDLLPSNPGVLHTLGLAQMRTGDLEQARRNLSIALELMPANPTLLLDFGLLTMRMGDEPAGKHYVELALRYADQLRLEFDRRSEAEQLLAAESKTPEAA